MDIIEFNRDLLDETAALMAKAYGTLFHKDYYVPTPLDRLYELWDSNRLLVMGCVDENDNTKVSAVVTYEIPTENDCYVNYTDLSFPAETCIHAESVAVEKKYRGKHLQQFLLEAGENVLRMRYPERIHSFCTVHPNNTPSVKNLKAVGYSEIVHYDYLPDKKHAGLNRSIMYKKLI